MCAILNKWTRLLQNFGVVLVFVMASVQFAITALQAETASTPKEPSPETYLQIVNATSVPKISLSVNGDLIYPELAQGLWTGNAPWKDLTVHYEAIDLKNGRSAKSPSITFAPRAYQTLVIMGDFSTDEPPGKLPQLHEGEAPAKKAYPPNVLFRVYTHEMQPDERLLRFRFVNAMPRTLLKISGATVASSDVVPGGDLILNGQPKPAHYEAWVSGKVIPITLVQRKDNNQTVIFYLKNGEPAYVTVSEERN